MAGYPRSPAVLASYHGGSVNNKCFTKRHQETVDE